MKNDLATAIVTAVIGLVMAFFITNLLIGEIEPVTYKTIEREINSELIDPNPEVFNYRALNPTVEAYVGFCTEYDEDGRCIEESQQQTTEEDETSQETN